MQIIIDDVCEWLRKQLESSSKLGYVIGISGGKDSAVAAALAVRAVGCENVMGVPMPNGEQADIDDSIKVCESLGIDYRIIDIEKIYNDFILALGSISAPSKINISPRIRMTILYALAQHKHYLVLGTGNKSEKHIGYCTKWGDTACDVNPLGNFTTDEVINIGRVLGLPEKILTKPPSDGLCGLTDEDKIGFSYDVLNRYIKTGECNENRIKIKINKMHRINRHKLRVVPVFKPKYDINTNIH